MFHMWGVVGIVLITSGFDGGGGVDAQNPHFPVTFFHSYLFF